MVKRASILSSSTLLFFFLSVSLAASDKGSTYEDTLTVIADFSDRICNKVQTDGSSESTEFKATLNADIPKLIRSIVQAGGDIEMKSINNKYEGVLQKDLPKIIESSQNCREGISKYLIEKLINANSVPSTLPSPIYPSPQLGKSCAKAIDCPGFSNAPGLWRGHISNGPIVSIDVKKYNETLTANLIFVNEHDVSCIMKLSLFKNFDYQLTQTDFVFKPSHDDQCLVKDIENVTLTPQPNTAYLSITFSDGVQDVIVVNKKI